jgi:hypothetical protein
MQTRCTNNWTAILQLVIAPLATAALQAQTTSDALVTVTTNAPVTPSQPASAGFALQPVGIVKEVEKLKQSGADPALIKSFVGSWPSPYSISADDILRLRDDGVASDILTLLIEHGAELDAQAAAAANAYSMAGTANLPPPDASGTQPLASTPAPPIVDQYAPQPAYPVEPGVDAYSSYPVYDSGAYGYPGPYYSPGVVVGGIGVRHEHGRHEGFVEHRGEHFETGRGFEGHGAGHSGSFGGRGTSVGGTVGTLSSHGGGAFSHSSSVGSHAATPSGHAVSSGGSGGAGGHH